MSKAAPETLSGSPLTVYSEDENMFRASVREFAEGEIRSRVEEMDEHAKMSPEIIKHLFDLGLMGIETPEEYGGSKKARRDSSRARRRTSSASALRQPLKSFSTAARFQKKTCSASSARAIKSPSRL